MRSLRCVVVAKLICFFSIAGPLSGNALRYLPLESGFTVSFSKISENFADLHYLMRTLYGKKAASLLVSGWSKSIQGLSGLPLGKSRLFDSLTGGDGALGFWGWRHRKFALIVKFKKTKNIVSSIDNMLRKIAKFKGTIWRFSFRGIPVKVFGPRNALHAFYYYFKKGYLVVTNTRQGVFDTLVASLVWKRSFAARRRLINRAKKRSKKSVWFFFTGKALHDLAEERLRFYEFFQENRVFGDLKYGVLQFYSEDRAKIFCELRLRSYAVMQRFLLGGMLQSGRHRTLFGLQKGNTAMQLFVTVAPRYFWRVLLGAFAKHRGGLYTTLLKTLKPDLSFYLIRKPDKSYALVAVGQLKKGKWRRDIIRRLFSLKYNKIFSHKDTALFSISLKKKVPFLGSKIFLYFKGRYLYLSGAQLKESFLKTFLPVAKKQKYGALFCKMAPAMLRSALDAALIRENFLYTLAQMFSGARSLSVDFVADRSTLSVSFSVELMEQ